jgi:lipopolysaccharide/colanic/teichoic acid biosynthesis glycosyltransferase
VLVTLYKKAVKPALDRIFALVLLIVVSPVLVIVALMVRARMGSPVLFRQERPGLDDHGFYLLKFRTMTVATPNTTVGDDSSRLTPLGRVLRQTSIDELPSLINIARGQMSFVGPRPLLMEYLPLYSPTQAQRHRVRPGLTGLAQVSGRNSADWATRLDYDVHYVHNISLAMDASIILKSVWVVLGQKGISDGKTATMTPFTGNNGVSLGSS